MGICRGGGSIQSAYADEVENSGGAGAVAQPESADDPAEAGASAGAGEAGAQAAAPAAPGAPLLATALAGQPSSFVNADVPLSDDAAPVVGSFTVDGLTYAISNDGDVALVSVAGGFDAERSAASPFRGTPPESEEFAEGESANISIPESVTYADVSYSVTAIAPYAFYLSDVAEATLPATVGAVDARAFRSSAVQAVHVADGNPAYSSYDGVLYNAGQTHLLLIPEGRQGAVRIPAQAETFDAEAVSHSALVEAFSVDAGSTHFASWDGLLYTADGATLLKVPAGAASIAVHDGCTAVAAGALAGCAKLESIEAPASVTSISPDAFTVVPTISLLATAVADDIAGAEGEAEVPPRRVVASSQGLEAPLALPDLGSTSTSPSSGAETQTASQDEENPSVASTLVDQVNVSTDFALQLTAMVALSATDDDLPAVDPAAITISLPEGSMLDAWRALGFTDFGKQSNLEGELQNAALHSSDSIIGHVTFHVPKGYYISGRFIASNEAVTLPVTTSDGGSITAFWGAPVAFDTVRLVAVGNESTHGREFGELRTYFATSTARAGWVGSDVFSSSTREKVESGLWFLDESYSTKSRGEYQLLHGDAIPSHLYWHPMTSPVTFDSCGGSEPPASFELSIDASMPLLESAPTKAGYRFIGWFDDDGVRYYNEDGTSAHKWDKMLGATLYAQWERIDYDLGFDVDSEPGDEDYAGEPKDDQTVNVESGPTPIEDPKRPGYVFEGWVIPSADGTEAIDQELVYQDDDGKWYVDASKLPDYAGDDGRVELTARWTSIISVDVPNTVTFYADTVTQGQESREGRAEGAFGQNKVESRSEVDLRVVGLESSAVATTGDTLGADSVLKKADAATPSTSAAKLLSLYPSAKQWTADELQDPGAVGGTKDAAAVDFDLDDILLEASFSPDSFTIPAGDTLNMGYRLNLAETGQQLDYDKLSTLEDGQSAAIANISYCFAADYGMPFWTTDDDGSTLNVFAIKADAEKIAAGDVATTEKYTRWMNADHRFYVKWYDQGVTEAEDPTAATIYDVRIIGINHDDKSDGSGKAGLTFQFVNLLKDEYVIRTGGTSAPSWVSNNHDLRDAMSGGTGSIYLQAPATLRSLMPSTRHTAGRWWDSKVEAVLTVDDTLFLLSYYELTGSIGTYITSPDIKWMAKEGTPYEYYAAQGIKHQTANAALSKRRQLADGSLEGSASFWWTRTLSPDKEKFIIGPRPNGDPDEHNFYYNQGGVCPAFCL